MTTSARLGITELGSTQNDRSVTVNEAIARLEAGATMFAAIQVSLDTPPGSPAEGDLYVIGAAPTGAWASNAKKVTVYYNAAWLFIPLFEGQMAYDQTANALYKYDGSAWGLIPGGLASTTEVLTGTDAAKAVTPDALAALWEAGADNAGDGTITIGEGGYFNLITSVVAITAFTITTDKAGRTFRCRFDTARTLTHNGTSLILPGAANITTAAGDIAQFRSLGSGNVVCEWFQRGDGKLLVPAGSVSAPGLAVGQADTGLHRPSSTQLNATVGGADRLAFSTTSTLFDNLGGTSNSFSVRGEGFNSVISQRSSTDAAAPQFRFTKSRGTIVSPTVVVTNDVLGDLFWYGRGNTAFKEGARIAAQVKAATPSDTDMQSDMVFYTTAAGATAATEVTRINNDAGLSMFGANPVIDANRHHQLRSYTVATLPSAATAGQFIYVSDESGGATPAFSDGTNWRRVADRAIVS
jgi:hypothetical protein